MKHEGEAPLTRATPVRKRIEAGEISGILAFQKYSMAAQTGAIASSLGPLLALSLMAVRSGLSGAEVVSAVQVMAEALASHGYRQAAKELLEGAIRGFVAGGDHQAAADLAELLALSSSASVAPPGDCIGLMDGGEEDNRPKRPVLFQLPPNWDDLSEEEQDEILDGILDLIEKG